MRCAHRDSILSVTKEAGFTLIELMVAMLILSVGLLALASLQASSLRSTQTAYMRTQAGIAAMEMAERMRVNIIGVNANQYMNVSSPPAGTAPTSCVTNNCSSTAIATDDIYQWLLSLQNSRDLASAQGTVVCEDSNGADTDVCTNGSPHAITVMWDGKRSGATGTGCDTGNASDLTCYRVRVRP
ncbi:type IV pilus modification protein PilV [Pseudomonadota bacterium]